MKPTLYPLKLHPALHVKVWGGRRLETLGKTLPTDEPYGESWEVHDSATVLNGALAGKTLGEVLADYGADLIGTGSDPAQGIPLLLKFLDANDWLSIQVHPDDAQAAELEGEPRGKTEAWVVLAAEAGARLVIGVPPGTTPEALMTAVRDNTLEQMVVYAEVSAGDVLFIPAGTIHALGPGLLIYEIQQSSDTTYRLYDWGRMGLDGKPRPLHIEKSACVANLNALPEIRHTAAEDGAQVTMVDSPFFQTVLHRLDGARGQQLDLSTGGTFHLLTSIDGAAVVRTRDDAVVLNAGETVFIPAALASFTAVTTGSARLLRSWLPR